jgi:hypothetical protein
MDFFGEEGSSGRKILQTRNRTIANGYIGKARFTTEFRTSRQQQTRTAEKETKREGDKKKRPGLDLSPETWK